LCDVTRPKNYCCGQCPEDGHIIGKTNRQETLVRCVQLSFFSEQTVYFYISSLLCMSARRFCTINFAYCVYCCITNTEQHGFCDEGLRDVILEAIMSYVTKCDGGVIFRLKCVTSFTDVPKTA